MSESDAHVGFVAVSPAAIAALTDAHATSCAAARALGAALDGLLELAEDMQIEAARRLRERGASEAQIERYEQAYRDEAARVTAARRALDEAESALGTAIDRVR